jgi:hypothetical protein
MASAPLYAHYATTSRTWGPTPLEDQQAAGGIMWVGGDIVFITILIGMTWLWMRAEERRSVGEDRRLEAERAAIREREVRLAARRAAEAAGSHGDRGSPPADQAWAGRRLEVLDGRRGRRCRRTRRRRRPSSPRRPASAAWNRIAAIVSAPDGRPPAAPPRRDPIAAAISSWSPVTTSSSRTRRWAKFRRRIDGAASAIVRPTPRRQVMMRRPPATPGVRGELGLDADDPHLARAPGSRRRPLASPPPRRDEDGGDPGRSSAISSPIAPWPGMIRASS